MRATIMIGLAAVTAPAIAQPVAAQEQTKETAIALPGELRKFVGRASRGELEVRFRGLDEHARMIYVLGHQLTVLSVELEVASHRVEGPGREHVLRARGLAKELLGDVRSVVGTQRERQFDLPAALAKVTEEIPHPQVHLEIAPEVVPDDEHAATLVRAVQEIATNTIRHSQADNLWIWLTVDDGSLVLEAHDDGVGAATVTPGNGLRGLRERAEAVGGRVETDGTKGFRVQVALPVPQVVAP